MFLEYADTKKLVSINNRGEDLESPFEESVNELLTSFGYKIHKQVGCANFRIDIAVVDPQSPVIYILESNVMEQCTIVHQLLETVID